MVVDEYDTDQVAPFRRTLPRLATGLTWSRHRASWAGPGSPFWGGFEFLPNLPSERSFEALCGRMALAEII